MTKKAKPAEHPAPWRIHFFQRHPSDNPTRAAPALEFLRACPTKVEAMIVAVVKAVADAPPPRVQRRRQMGSHARRDGRSLIANR